MPERVHAVPRVELKRVPLKMELSSSLDRSFHTILQVLAKVAFLAGMGDS